MRLNRLLDQLDHVVMLNFGDFREAVRSKEGSKIVQHILSDSIRADLLRWCRKIGGNDGAVEFREYIQYRLSELER